MPATVDVFLSISSPFSYLAWTRLPDLRARTACEYRFHLLDLAQVWEMSGNPGPVSVGPKLKYLLDDALRWAEQYGVVLNLPQAFVFDNNPAARVFQAVSGVGGEAPFIERLMRGYWVDGENFAEPETLYRAAAEAGVSRSQVDEALNDPAAGEAVRQQAREAVERGVFGVPTFLLGDELFWGNDRLQFLEQSLVSTRQK